MKFGRTEHPEKIDFALPPDHPDTAETLKKYKSDAPFEVYVGCAKWNKADLKGFYPRGTKDELTYYSRQFNSIELNATFYNSPDKNQVVQWKEKTPEDFKFFPKIPQSVSHYRRLNDVKNLTEDFADSVSMFEEKLGMVFLQMIDNFKPKFIDRVESFAQNFPKGVPLAIEVRNEDWFKGEVFDAYFDILKKNNITNIIVDAAARRDMLHMRLSNDAAFIRYVGANHKSDYSRLEDWVERIKVWRSHGLQKLYFFIHQNIEKESPLLAEHFIKLLNSELGLSLKIPNSPDNPFGF
ncbi:Uncharacterized conserved protein YecE, DUF72 family [Algoriphagus locisalis]|uniref:Uncharacterized conserved protein YecE, DUF72 family n=1 Tax=Algoriphagus locisalis TaxID=305507 RepID=A0A1I7BZ38_9BACT|nr:DUF72 domain-containing protein [Algoriphagus locisalis]SFT92437.1 Uncharacterized conserved protein YecE, DUF72 family [Algoriphagus locisalis]